MDFLKNIALEQKVKDIQADYLHRPKEQRKGLHASTIIKMNKKDYCLRELYYHINNGTPPKDIGADTLAIFEQGNLVHQKWEKIFSAHDPDCKIEAKTYSPKYRMTFTPDIIATIDGVKYIIEVKTVNSFQFRKITNKHVHGTLQLQFYQAMTGIKDGFVLCECKDTQKVKVLYNRFDKSQIADIIPIMEEIANMNASGIIPDRCSQSVKSPTCHNCPFKGVCFNG